MVIRPWCPIEIGARVSATSSASPLQALLTCVSAFRNACWRRISPAALGESQWHQRFR